jgi:hypothetical protein
MKPNEYLHLYANLPIDYRYKTAITFHNPDGSSVPLTPHDIYLMIKEVNDLWGKALDIINSIKEWLEDAKVEDSSGSDD